MPNLIIDFVGPAKPRASHGQRPKKGLEGLVYFISQLLFTLNSIIFNLKDQSRSFRFWCADQSLILD